MSKKPADPTKSVLRLPTPTTLRKEAGATPEEIANTDPKAAKKYGKEKVKEVRDTSSPRMAAAAASRWRAGRTLW